MFHSVAGSFHQAVFSEGGFCVGMKVDADSLRFVEVVEIVFRGWTAIQLAVQHEFGGSDSADKAKWSTESVAERIEKNPQMHQHDVSLLHSDLDLIYCGLKILVN